MVQEESYSCNDNWLKVGNLVRQWFLVVCLKLLGELLVYDLCFNLQIILFVLVGKD